MTEPCFCCAWTLPTEQANKTILAFSIGFAILQQKQEPVKATPEKFFCQCAPVLAVKYVPSYLCRTKVLYKYRCTLYGFRACRTVRGRQDGQRACRTVRGRQDGQRACRTVRGLAGRSEGLQDGQRAAGRSEGGRTVRANQTFV